MNISEEVIEKIEACLTPRLIGVSGFGGSGKTTFARSLGERIDAPVIGIDDFIVNRLQGDIHAWDGLDYDRFVREVGTPFLNGATTITYGVYDWASNTIPSERVVNTTGTLIVEGIGIFRPGLIEKFAVKIWVDCPLEVAIERGATRDRGWGADHDALWRGIWRQNELEFVERHDPKAAADIMIPN